MKKSELRQIIKEEIKRVLKENISDEESLWKEWAAGEIEVGNDNVGMDFRDADNESLNVFDYYVKAVKALNAASEELRSDIAAAVSGILYSSGNYENYTFDVITAGQFAKIVKMLNN